MFNDLHGNWINKNRVQCSIREQRREPMLDCEDSGPWKKTQAHAIPPSSLVTRRREKGQSMKSLAL